MIQHLNVYTVARRLKVYAWVGRGSHNGVDLDEAFTLSASHEHTKERSGGKH